MKVRMMEDNYIYFPIVTIGGTTGDYYVDCPVTSCKFAEYKIVSVSTLANCAVYVSGDSKTIQLPIDGSATLSGNTTGKGQFFAMSGTSTVTDCSEYDRITHSQKRVFVRIDNDGKSSTYVGIKFRIMPVTIVPGPAKATHPDLGHQMNIERERNIKATIPERGKVNVR
jgi:hypothetical protein